MINGLKIMSENKYWGLDTWDDIFMSILNKYIFIQCMNEWAFIGGVSYKSKHVFNNFHVNYQRLPVWAGWYMTLKFTPSCHVVNDEWGWIKIKLISRLTLTNSQGIQNRSEWVGELNKKITDRQNAKSVPGQLMMPSLELSGRIS